MGRKQPPVKRCQNCGRSLKGHRLPIGPGCTLEPDPQNLQRNTEAQIKRRLALNFRKRQRTQHQEVSLAVSTDNNQPPVKSCQKCGRALKGHRMPIGPGCTLEPDPQNLQRNTEAQIKRRHALNLRKRQRTRHREVSLAVSTSSVTVVPLGGEERGRALPPPGLLCCPACGRPCPSHALLLAHTAAAHPTRLDRTAVGRLGNVLAYQATAGLFHCSACLFTCGRFAKLFSHLLAAHCPAGGQAAEEEEEEEEEQEQGGPPEEEEEEEEQGGPPKEAEIISYSQSRYVCVLCGWRSRLRGSAHSHVVTVHRVEGRFSGGPRSSSVQHLPPQHRPARYGCPYCPFTAHRLSGFKRHCQLCRGGGGGGEEEEEGGVEKMEEQTIVEEEEEQDE